MVVSKKMIKVREMAKTNSRNSKNKTNLFYIKQWLEQAQNR